jgi:hypothetical protein
MSDGRVFYTSISAAKHYGLPIAHQIEFCCNGIIPTVEGTEWRWVYGKRKIDPGDVEDLRGRISAVMRKYEKNWSENRNYYRRAGKAKTKSHRQQIFPIANFFRYWAKDLRSKEPVRTSEVFKELEKWCIEENQVLTTETDRALAKHLEAWKLLYERVVGLVLKKHPFGKYNRKYSSVRIDPSLIIPGMSIYDEISEYANPEIKPAEVPKLKSGIKGIPIYCHNDGVTYPSMKIASEVSLCYTQDIKYVCEGDLESISRGDQIWKFSYGRWENVSIDWFVDTGRYTFHNTSSVSVMDLVSGEAFNSIREASKVSGIPRDKIKLFCEEGDPHGPGITSRRFSDDKSRRWVFSYIKEEDEW